MCWDMGDFEWTPPPSVVRFKLSENRKKKSSEPLEIYVDSPVSQKARQNQITYFKSTRKISLGGMNFWNPGSQKDENFPIFCVLSTCQTAKVWAIDMIFIYMLYLGNLPSAGKNCHFCRKKMIFFKSSDFEHVPYCQALNNSANFSIFFLSN